MTSTMNQQITNHILKFTFVVLIKFRIPNAHAVVLNIYIISFKKLTMVTIMHDIFHVMSKSGANITFRHTMVDIEIIILIQPT